ncbi:hypothetical protein AHF37_08444 [Paragonimus kellicotti]|nr:hypothetical protein AHF37_08444 [Paragonimus kellicotti]
MPPSPFASFRIHTKSVSACNDCREIALRGKWSISMNRGLDIPLSIGFRV